MAVYAFLAKSCGRCQSLWPSDKREIRWASALLPLAYANWRLPWRPKVTAVGFARACKTSAMRLGNWE